MNVRLKFITLAVLVTAIASAQVVPQVYTLFAIKLSGLSFYGTAPTVSACGSSFSIDSRATANSGTVTSGTGGLTSCTITFAVAYATWNHCVVSAHQSDAGFAYSYTLTAITVTATSLTSEVFDYACDGV